MIFFKYFLPFVFSLLLMSCGGSSISVNFDYVVDVLTGEDSNPGTATEPFKTITKALSVAESTERIKVRPGLYDRWSGEVFPLVVPAGVELIGNEETIGLDTTIDGGMFWPIDGIPADPLLTALLASDSVFAGFSIDFVSDVDSIVLYLDGDRIQVRNNTLSGMAPENEYSEGIVVGSGNNQRITGNTLDGYSSAGLLFSGAGDNAVVQDNIITRNQVGVLKSGADGINIDLGGGVQGSAGGNVLSCNTLANLRVFAGAVVDASNNFWDHVPPTSSPPDEIPVDILLSTLGGPAPIVNTGNDQLAASPCN